MKKGIIVGVIMVMAVGCGKKTKEVIGSWTTEYELGMYGEITQTYEFHKDNTCKKILMTDMKIEKECTYEIKEDKIEMTYEDGQVRIVSYRVDGDDLIIGGYRHTKSK